MKGIQDILVNAGKYACLALDYSYIAELGKHPEGFNPEVFATKVQLFLDILDALNSGLVDDEFYVKDAKKFLTYLDPSKKWTVTKKDIKSMTELRGKVGCVRFDYQGHSHWVAFADGIVAFDPLADSQCRLHGKPVTARIVEVEDEV